MRRDIGAGWRSWLCSGSSIGCTTVAAGTPVGTPALYYDPCVFTNPAFGVYGTAGRHTLIGAKYNSLDFLYTGTVLHGSPYMMLFTSGRSFSVDST